MRYIKDLHEGETIRNVYLCKGKRSAETRNGKPYDNLILQDKTEKMTMVISCLKMPNTHEFSGDRRV